MAVGGSLLLLQVGSHLLRCRSLRSVTIFDVVLS